MAVHKADSCSNRISVIFALCSKHFPRCWLKPENSLILQIRGSIANVGECALLNEEGLFRIWNRRLKTILSAHLTFWRRNYFFLILEHTVYKM